MTNESSPMRLIRRYKNRKFYDTEKSTYINIDEILDLFKKTNGRVRVESYFPHTGSTIDITEDVIFSAAFAELAMDKAYKSSFVASLAQGKKEVPNENRA